MRIIFLLLSLTMLKNFLHFENNFIGKYIMKKSIIFLCYTIILFSLFFSSNAKGQSLPANFYNPKVDYSSGVRPRSISSSDLDGDGKLDMVIANSGSNTISILQNTSSIGIIGASSFTPKIDFNTGNDPRSVAIGDLNGDGKPDIVVANFNSGTISVLQNTSLPGSINSSSFASKVDFISSSAFNVAISDLDGDGKPDIIVANLGTQSISVFHNISSSGNISLSSFSSKIDFAASFRPVSIDIDDIDGDGKKDIVVANASIASVSVLRNTSTPGIMNSTSFASKVDFATSSTLESVAVGDIDGDGKPDVVVSNVNSNSISVLRNNSTIGIINSSSLATKVDFVTGDQPFFVAINDLDGDGKPDLVGANFGSNTISVLRNSSMSGIISLSSFEAKTDFATGTAPVSIVINDFDGDNSPEIAVANYNSTSISIFQRTPPPSPAGALNFDGTNDQVELGNWFDNQEFTIEMWLNPGSSQALYANILDNAHSDSRGFVVQQDANNLNKYYFAVSSNAGPITLINFELTANQWQHLAFVKGVSSISVYINGVLKGNKPYSGNVFYDGSQFLTLGNFRGGGRNWNGSMDEVRIWNNVLSEAQLNHSKNCELVLPQSNLVAYYKFNQGISNANNSGINTLSDESGNNRNGSLLNFALSSTLSNWVPGNVTGNCTPFDVAPPEIVCPQNIVVSTTSGLCTAVVNFEATATDPSGVSSISYSHNPGSVFPKGKTIVIVTATDNLGYSSNCSFEVLVEDNEKPAVTTQNIIVQLEANGTATITPAQINNNSTDNCTAVIDLQLELDKTAFNCSNLGLNSVTLTVTDANGNVETGTAKVIVEAGLSLVIYYKDTDGDGFGDGSESVSSCSAVSGYVTTSGDCNDNNAAIKPGAIEICDGLDNDCDGTIDEGVLNTYYLDADGDGYGDPTQSTQACSAPPGYVSQSGDCFDNNNALNPGVTEICDGIDNNCNGQIDEGLTLFTWYQDSDGDGKGTASVSVQNCGQPSGYVGNSDDCNDNDNTIYTGATEICDGKDNDCDGIIDNGVLITYYKDQDNDGFGDPASTIQACSVPSGYVATNTDCDDTKNNVYPGAPEICDGLDNDCDGSIDEGVKNTYYFDQDGDGFGNPALPLESCTAPAGYVSNNTECDDTRNTVYPGAPEICDGLDNDCDNLVDEGITFTTYYKDNDGDGYGDASQSVSSCSTVAGYVTIAGDCNDNATAINPGAVEVCDGVDNDCDGQIDEGLLNTYYPDTDGDGYGKSTGSVTACTAPAGFVSNNTDCNDNDNSIYPGATELCDGKDNDCDGTIDDGITFLTYYKDTDGDGYGDASQSVSSCSAVAGYVTTAGDCNDNSTAISPGAVEVCDGIDNDCDGQIDEGLLNTYYPDTDGDGYGKSTGSVTACTAPAGFVSNNIDCNDNDNSIYPGASELCDGKDNDCDGTIDDGITYLTYYKDTDGDGYGDASQSVSSCSAVAGYVTTSGDCNDNNAAIKTGATEVCNGVDDDCDGSIDEDVKNTYYQDSDADGFGNASVSVQACAAPTGYVSNNTDCNDNNAAVKPGAIEICNGIDDDCDGQIDEGVKNTYYQDSDGDGFGKASVSVLACTAPAGYVSNNTDCNDNNAAIKPGATEICGNGIDDDCDGLTDEGCTPVNLSKVYISNAYVTEGNSGTRNAVFTLWLSSKSATPVTVQYQTANISATAPADYVTKTGTVTFPANSLFQVVTVQVKGDLLNESNESFRVSLASPVNATLGNTSGTGFINDDDRQPAIKIDNASATENSQLASVKVYLTAASGQVVKVKYDTKDESAKSPADYTAIKNGQLVFQPGETVKYINVVIKKDFLNERTEEFEVKLKDAENATLESSWGGRREADVSILNSASSYHNSIIGLKETELTEQSLNLQVKVLPNPSQHQFQVNITGNGKGTLHLRVTDMQGRLLEERKTEGMTQQIKLGENWINGTYILQVTQGEERKTIQLVKLR